MTARPAHYNTRYKFDLTPRQREVLDLIARGRTNAEIAGDLGVTLDGAKYHVREILAKLDMVSREEAASYWRNYSRPSAKLGRALGSVFGLGTLKAVAGGTAVIAMGGAVAAIIVGINAARETGSGAETAGTVPAADTPALTATPAATVTPPVAETPELFAQRIAAMIAAGQLEELLALSEPVTFACPGPVPQGAGGPFPLCNGAAPGEERQGYITLRDASEAETIAPDAFRQSVSDLLTPDLSLTSIGTPASGDAIVLGFAASTADAVYLTFDVPAGTEPQLRGLGATAAQATPILEGGEAILLTGPTTFVPVN